MNYEDLQHKISYIQAANGHTLTVEERSALQTSLPLLKNTSKLRYLQFWGKVFGTHKDYLIAQGYSTTDLFTGKKLFCSHNAVEWVQLPELSEETKGLCKKIAASRVRLSGDLSHEYTVEIVVGETLEPHHAIPQKQDGPSSIEIIDDSDEEEDGDAEETLKVGRPSVQTSKRAVITEEKQLVYLVDSISFDTSIVPRGAVTLTATRHVVPNKVFAGLRSAQADNTQFYVHLRPPLTASRKSSLQKEGLSKSLDFLDTIDEDIPKGSWCLHSVKSAPLVTIRSLVWPGSFFYHAPGTPNYGYCYFGFGDKNVDLGFML